MTDRLSILVPDCVEFEGLLSAGNSLSPLTNVSPAVLTLSFRAEPDSPLKRPENGCRDFDITEIDITESDVTETDITENDITESHITESDIT